MLGEALDLLAGPCVAQWSVWTTTARVVVTDATVLDAARALIEARLAEIDLAASRFRPDSEVSRLAASGTGRPVKVSPVLAGLVDIALEAARRTDGDVDPTLGGALSSLGYDRDLSAADGHKVATTRAGRASVHLRNAVTWRAITLDGTTLTVPPGVLLDLGATAKARAADLCATNVAENFGCGVMVGLGGDLRVAGAPPADGWEILVQDGAGEPASRIRLSGADAVATSSTLHRVWQHDGRRQHHILDPASGVPAVPLWRTVSVAAATCVDANVLTTAAMVRGLRGIALLESAGVAARLVARDGSIHLIGGWPR